MNQESIAIQLNQLGDFCCFPRFATVREGGLGDIDLAKGIVGRILLGRECGEGKKDNGIPLLFDFNTRIPLLFSCEVDAFGGLLIGLISVDPNPELVRSSIKGDCPWGG